MTAVAQTEEPLRWIDLIKSSFTLSFAPAEAAPAERCGFNTNEAAAFCGISRVTLTRDKNRGLVSCNHRGIYAREELERYLRETAVRKDMPAASKAGRPRRKRVVI